MTRAQCHMEGIPQFGDECNIVTYPAAEFQEKYRLSVTDTVVNSTRYPGDRELTCMFRMHLTHIQEGRYTFAVEFRAPVRDYKPTIKHADSIPALDLKATAHDLTDPVTFDPTTEDFQLDILVTSNPPPHQFSLSMRYDESSAYVPVSTQYYSATYNRSEEDQLRGRIQLRVRSTTFRNEQRKGYFSLTADNGVIGDTPFEVAFTIARPN
ncbi:hypothetical protein ElyMa_001835500, partial [Elysia marginata]